MPYPGYVPPMSDEQKKFWEEFNKSISKKVPEPEYDWENQREHYDRREDTGAER